MVIRCFVGIVERNGWKKTMNIIQYPNPILLEKIDFIDDFNSAALKRLLTAVFTICSMMAKIKLLV